LLLSGRLLKQPGGTRLKARRYAVDARAAALSALAQFQVTETTVGEALQRIADITLEAVPAARVVGMSMIDDDGQPTTAVYTDDESPDIDEVQYRDNSGPCLEAWRNNVVLKIPSVEEQADTYPGFAAACRRHGVKSTLSLPMTAGAVAVGALNLYAHVEDGFDDDDEALGKDLAAAGAAVMVNVSAYWTAFDLSSQLTEAIESRAVIEQAKGMLMASRPDLTADEAFDLLRGASQRANIKLREIAARVVERRGDLGGVGQVSS
jgi:transcriptional regulator with GAF, ATPase, and Fis domain